MVVYRLLEAENLTLCYICKLDTKEICHVLLESKGLRTREAKGVNAS